MDNFTLFALDDNTFPSLFTRPAPKPEEQILESADSAPDSVAVFAAQQARGQVMSAVLAWVEEGEFTYTALDEFILGLADLDGDMEITEEEEDIYNSLWAHVPDAMLTLGAAWLREQIKNYMSMERQGGMK